jgi:hypothetical protein
MTGGRANRGAIAAAVILPGLALAACDPCMFMPCDGRIAVDVLNRCGFDVDVASAYGGDDSPALYPTTLSPDESSTLEEIGPAPEFDIWVRRTGTEDWTVVIPWDQVNANMIDGAEGYDLFSLSQENCPT